MNPKDRPGRTSSNRPRGHSSRTRNSATMPAPPEPGDQAHKEKAKKQPKTENAHSSHSPPNLVVGGQSARNSSNVSEARLRAPQATRKRYHHTANKDGSGLQSPLHNLKRLVNSVTRSNGFKSVEQLEEFLHLALQALSVKDRDVAMTAALILGNDECLPILRDIVEGIGSPMLQQPLSKLRLDKHVVPFMKVIVHKAFSSLSLEEAFERLINTFCGPDGERAVRFCHGTLERLPKQNIALHNSSPEHIYLVSCVLNCVARYKNRTMELQGLVSIHRRLHDLAKALNSTHMARRIAQSLDETATNLIPALSTRTAAVDTLWPRTEFENNADRFSKFRSLMDGPATRVSPALPSY